MRLLTSVLIALSVLGFSNQVAVAQKPPQAPPPPADASTAAVKMSGAYVLIGTGDIGECSTRGAIATAKLMDSVLRADDSAHVHDEVFTLGDNAYPGGSIRDYEKCFTPTWGDSAKVIMKNIRPSLGNHDYGTGGAAPYFQFFGKRAGPPNKGYYSYDVGEWHAIVLNSEMVVNVSFSSADRQAQLDWLAEDLKSNNKVCTVAYWHHPRFSSGWHGSDKRMAPFWQLLYDGGADLVLVGHDHNYERFLPQTPDGVVDSTKGIVQIVSGTGGGDLRDFKTPLPLSAYRVEGHYGVLKLTLGATSYTSAFLGSDGTIWDRAGGNCH